MKDKRVGVYILDGMKFDLFLTGGTDCSFTWPTSPASKLDRPKCEVGCDQDWHSVVKGLLHELMEASFMESGCLFERSVWLTDTSTGRHVLHCDHAKFTEICHVVGDVLTWALPDLRSAYKKARKPK